jgi:uncharacterized cysteine cluster protein YcgN (CxxCxxCC family)
MKCRQKQKIKKSWGKLRESVQTGKKSERFKWQSLCKPRHFNDVFDMDELRDLALDEGIPQHLFLTKRELCYEFAKRFDEPKCINNTSITLTDIHDIPPEFFYSYTHNNKVYCDDIRDLQRHFNTNGEKHPIDRSPVSQDLVNQVNYWFHHLSNTTNSMKDFDSEPVELPASSILSSKAAAFASLLNYPNNIHHFITADSQTIKRFIEKLIEENLMSRVERAKISVINDITSYKSTLLDMLTLKIKNDPATILVGDRILSTVAINISNVWNEIF